MTPVMTALLKPHITRLNGSIGSGTDFGRTTFSLTGEFVEITAAPCPSAEGARSSERASSNETPRLRREVIMAATRLRKHPSGPAAKTWPRHARAGFYYSSCHKNLNGKNGGRHGVFS